MTTDSMLLHNSYINVTIAVILSPNLSLYDLPKPKYKNAILAPEGVFREISQQASE